MRLDRFVQFSRELDQRPTDQLFDSSLLYLMQKYLGYSCVSVTSYDNWHLTKCEILGSKDVNFRDVSQYYTNEFSQKDQYASFITQNLKSKPDSGVFQSSRVLNSEYKQSLYYNFLKNCGLAWTITMPLGNLRFSVYKRQDDKDFTESERAAFELVYSLLKSKYSMAERAAESRVKNSAMENLLDSLQIGCCFLDGDFNLMSYNSFAARVLSQVPNASGLKEACAILVAQVKSRENRRLGGHNVISATIGEYSFEIEQFEYNHAGEQRQSHMMMISNESNRDSSQQLETRLAEQFGITEREFMIARQIVMGKSYKEVAGQMFISVNTVRTHIKNIYSKLGINNQRALACLFTNRNMEI